jgi:hypothetical protein
VDSEAPGYPTGFGLSLAAPCAGVIASVVLDVIYARVNRKRAKVTEEEVREKYSETDLAAMGNHSPLFNYTP